MVLQKFFAIDPEGSAIYIDKAQRLLMDKDPAVIGAALHIVYDLCVLDPAKYRVLVPSLVSILKQITEHRLPRDFDYHRIPAPWIQIKLLQILGVLGAMDRAASEGMYEILGEVLKRADIGINVGFAIVYECVRTITKIYPDHPLLGEAAKCVSRFITSENHNLKYLGINALAAIVQVDPKYAVEHQLVVIDCLEDSDETLRRKTIDLLYKMTTPQNVVIIVDKMVASLKATIDIFFRKDLVQRITSLAERFAPDAYWYVDIMGVVFDTAGDLVQMSVAHNLMKLIAESEDSSEATEKDVRTYAVDFYIEQLKKPVIQEIYIKVIAWVLGEFGHLSTSLSRSDVIQELVSVLERPLMEASEARAWAVCALIKLTAHSAEIPDVVSQVIQRYKASVDVDLQQRCHEYWELLKSMKTLRTVFPLQGYSEDIQADDELEFLNGYVNAALAAGASRYNPDVAAEFETRMSRARTSAGDLGLNFQPYQAPATTGSSLSMEPSVRLPTLSGGYGTSPPSSRGIPASGGAEGELTLRVKGSKTVWGIDKGQPSEEIRPAASSYSTPSYAASVPVTASAPSRESRPLTSSVSTNPPAALSEKEQLAKALFGGGAVPVSREAGRKKTTTSKPSEKSSKFAPAKPPVTSEPVPAETRSQPQGTSPSTGSILVPAPVKKQDNLLDLTDLWSSPAPTPALRGPATAPSTADDFLFGTASSAAPTASPVSSVQAPATAPLDPFDFLMGGMPEKKEAPSSGSSSSSPIHGHDLMPADLRDKLASLARSSAKDTTIGSDSCLNLSYYWMFAPHVSVATFFFVNKSRSSLANVTCSFSLPAGFSIGFDCVPPASTEGTTICWRTLESGRVGIAMVSIAPGSPEAVFEGKVPIQVSYLEGSRPCSFRCEAPISVVESLRPLPLTTPQFGALWPTNTAEAKFQIPSRVTTSDAVMETLKTKFRFHPVQTIGVENIASAYICHGSPSKTSIVLCHIKVGAGSLEIQVHSGSPAATKFVANALTRF